MSIILGRVSDFINFFNTSSELVDPGRPLVIAHLTGDTVTMRGCILYISWIVPEDTDVSEVTHYVINIDGVNIYNETNAINEKFLSLSFLVQSCTPHNTSVKIINRCGRASPPSPTVSNITREPLICDDSVCKDNTITGDYIHCNFFY